MKRIAVKRLVYAPDYATLWKKELSSNVCIGAEEYDKRLTNFNILGSIREKNKWDWASSYGDCLVRADGLQYVRVCIFYKYEPSWFDKIKKWFTK